MRRSERNLSWVTI